MRQLLKKITGLILWPIKFVGRLIVKHNTIFNFVIFIVAIYFTISCALNDRWAGFGLWLANVVLFSFLFGLSVDSWLTERAQKKYDKKREEYEAEKYARHISEWLN